MEEPSLRQRYADVLGHLEESPLSDLPEFREAGLEAETDSLLEKVEPYLRARQAFQRIYGYHRLLNDLQRDRALWESDPVLHDWAVKELSRVDAGPYPEAQAEEFRLEQKHQADLGRLKKLLSLRKRLTPAD